jgi:hypothetical protein
VSQPVLFAAELRKAGEILSASGADEESAAAAALAAITLAVRRLRSAPVTTPPPPAAPTIPADRVRTSGPSRAPALAPQERPGGGESSADLVGTWTRYQQLVAAGMGPASLEELLRGGAAASPRGNGGGGGGGGGGGAAEPVDIGTLLYKGARARARVQELRETAKRASGDTLRAIIDEVCDLVVLAIEPE